MTEVCKKGAVQVDAASYLQINLIPILALIIMRFSTERTLSYSWRNRALRFMMVLLAVIMALNMAAWIINGQQFIGARTLLWICNIGYFALLEFMAYLWFLYVRDILSNGIGQRGIRVLPPAIPLLVLLAILLTSPWTGAIFHFDENNYYVRGSLFLMHTAVTMFYVVCASVWALVRCGKETQEDRRNEFRWLACFAILPVFGGVLQVLFYGLELLLPFTVASLLMVYINVQQKQVTRDALTGLNNRRRLDEYLQELEEQNWGTDSCHLMLIDVNRFKKINDTYGHVTGDQVLKLIADQIKKVFGDSCSFLARYGGDEFVIILKGQSDKEVATDIQMLREGISRMNWGDGSPWKISVSVGCARYGEVPMHSVNELVKLADSRMYEEKNKKIIS